MQNNGNQIEADTTQGSSRRSLISKAGASAAAVALLSTMGPVGEVLIGKRAHAASGITDIDILNFALNLEYLEAEYYVRGTTGVGLPNSMTSGTGAFGGVNGGTLVPFRNSVIFQVMAKISTDEQSHVTFLRSALGSAAIARPLIDLAGGFQGAALAAGVIQPGGVFNPFADEISFTIGAMALEEVGVTAYGGAAALLTNSAYLSAAASILAVEAYHSGSIRGLLTQAAIGGTISGITNLVVDPAVAASLPLVTQQIANLQSVASNQVTAYGIVFPQSGTAAISTRDANALSYRRTTTQVLNIVTNGNGASHGGGLFPSGLNGTIR